MTNEFLKREIMNDEQLDQVAGGNVSGKGGAGNFDIPFGGDGVFISFPFRNASGNTRIIPRRHDWRPPGRL